VMMTTIVNRAIKGDLKAAEFLVRFAKAVQETSAADSEATVESADDKALIEAYLAQRSGHGAPGPAKADAAGRPQSATSDGRRPTGPTGDAPLPKSGPHGDDPG